MCFPLLSRRCETAAMTFRFSSVTSPTSMLGAWENISRVFQRRRWTRCPAIHGREISGNCRTLWSEPLCYLPVRRCACRWLKFLLTPASTRLGGAMRWSKPSGNRLCEHYAKATGLLEALVEQQLAWASSGRRSPTRCRSWEYLVPRSDGHLASAPKLCLPITSSEY